MDSILCPGFIHYVCPSGSEVVVNFAHTLLDNLAVDASLCSKSRMGINVDSVV